MKFVFFIGPSEKGHDLSKVLWVGFIVPSCRHFPSKLSYLECSKVTWGEKGDASAWLPVHGSVPMSNSFSLLYLKKALGDNLMCRCLLARQLSSRQLQNLSWHPYFFCRYFLCLVGGFLCLLRYSCCTNIMSNGNFRFWTEACGTGNTELEGKYKIEWKENFHLKMNQRLFQTQLNQQNIY